jgi:hypothetical protein
VQRKKYETYLNFIQNKKIQPQPEPKMTNTPQQRNIKNQLQKEINDFDFFKFNIESLEVNGKKYEEITTENWNERKLEFFNQRMSNYEDSFSQTEKIELEIDLFNKEEFETDKRKILKKRYLDLLNDKLNNTPHPQTQKNEIESQIEPFNTEIFKDQNSFNLFLFLTERYATTKQEVQFIQIYHWMREKESSIKASTGTKYKKFVKSRFPEMSTEFKRLTPKGELRYFDTVTLNDIEKEFNSLNKV